MNKDCPTQDNLSKFLSGEISANERDTFELHLAECAECRSNLALMFSEKTNEESFIAPDSLKEKVKNLPEKATVNSDSFFSFKWLKISRLQVGFASVLIVCFGLFGIYLLQNRQSSNSDDVLREGKQNSKNVPILLSPKNNAVIEGTIIEFEWEKISKANSYILTISDEKGDIVFQEQTKETKFTYRTVYRSKKSDLAQENYFWYVRAKMIDGKITETNPRKVTLKN